LPDLDIALFREILEHEGGGDEHETDRVIDGELELLRCAN
jgi:hypothetical protein